MNKVNCKMKQGAFIHSDLSEMFRHFGGKGVIEHFDFTEVPISNF